MPPARSGPVAHTRNRAAAREASPSAAKEPMRHTLTSPLPGPSAQPARVLLIGLNYAPEASGIAPYSASMTRGLAQRGHDVRVLTTKPHYPEWAVPEAYRGGAMHELIDGVQVTRLPHYVPNRPTGVRRLISEISFGLRALIAPWGRPDVVVFVSPALFATAVAMLRTRFSRRMHSIVWIQDLYGLGIVETGEHGAGSVVERVITGTEKSVLTTVDAVTVIHDRFAESVVELGVERDRIAVIRNWSHLGPEVPGDREEVRRRLGWGAGEVVALHTGNMGLKQDLGNLISAARLADQQDAQVRFVVMGNGSQRDALQRQAERDGVQRVQFVDAVPGELYLAALRAADVLLVNEAEGLRDMAVPSKLTSYFAAGRPVVAATDERSITASEVRAAGAGVQVAPGRPADLLAAVESIAADQDRSAEYGAHGAAYRARVLSEEGALDAFEVLLNRLRPASRGGSASNHGSHGRGGGRRQRRWATVSS